jgi:hypothetical protein
MRLSIPPKPPILTATTDQDWQKFFCFYALPLEHKAVVIDQHPDLLIERPPTYKYMDGPKARVFFNPNCFDTQVKLEDVARFWDQIIQVAGFYPKQPMSFEVNAGTTSTTLFNNLDILNRAVVGYKYRYIVRPEQYFFHQDFEMALVGATTILELLTFYDWFGK